MSTLSSSSSQKMMVLVVLLISLISLLHLTTPASAAVRNAAPSPSVHAVATPDLVTFTTSTADNGPIDQAFPSKFGFYPSIYGGLALPVSSRPDFTIDMPVMLPHKNDDILSCNTGLQSKNEYNQTYTGAWILIQQSSCADAKYAYAAASGARGVLLYGCSSGPPTNCEASLQSTVVRVSVGPVTLVTITHEDGQKIYDYLKAKQAAADPVTGPPKNTLVLTAKSSGPIAPAERAALVAIMTKTAMTSFTASPALDILPYWKKVNFQDPNYDPCTTNRTAGIWCEGNNIVIINMMYHFWQNLPGVGIPAEFGAFTELRQLSLFLNSFTGVIPGSVGGVNGTTGWCGMTKLRSLRLSFQLTTGITALPECVFPVLEEVMFGANAVKTFPQFITTTPSLKRIFTQLNIMTTLPSLAGLPNLEYIDISRNNFQGSFPIFNRSAPITTFSIGTNFFSGSIPSNAFDGMKQLQIVDINTNNFVGALPAMNNCPKLTVLDLSSQRNLTQSSSVGFSGEIPQSFYLLAGLKTLNLQENSLTSSTLIQTAQLQFLETLDLSNNLLVNPPAPSFPDGIVSRTLYGMVGPSLITLRLSYNNLSGPFGVTDSAAFKSTQKVYLDHNSITTIWLESLGAPYLTTLDLSYNALTAAGSTSLFPAASLPAPGFQLLNLVGNPNLQFDALPLFAIPSTSKVQQAGVPYACSTFGAITASTMVFAVDPQFVKYKYCVCQAGTFGKAPLCDAVPNNAALNPYSVISSDEIGSKFATLIAQTGGIGSQPINLTAAGLDSTQSIAAAGYTNPVGASSSPNTFSDSMYGENRLTLGLSTSWAIDVSNLYAENPDSYIANEQPIPASAKQIHIVTATNPADASWTQVRMITVRLHISATLFTRFDDQISVYAGGSDLRGERITTIRGSDTKPPASQSDYTSTAQYQALYGAALSKISDPRLYEVQIFSPTTAIQFTSRQTSGLHFFATYSYDFVCPSGYFYDTLSNPAQPKCRLNYVLYSMDMGLRGAVYAVASTALFFIFINMCILMYHWDNPVFKAASRAFMLLILVLMMAMALGAILYAAIPDIYSTSGDAICAGRAWLTCLPVAGVLAVMLAKNRRMWSIFGTTKLQVKVHSDMDLLVSVLIICSLQCVLLAVFTGMPLSKAVRELGTGGLSDKLLTHCSEESGFMSWIGAEIAFICALMIPSAYLGFKTRDLPSQYNESSHLQNALLLLIFFGVIIVPLDVYIHKDPESALLIQGLGQSFLCIVLTAILFLPKVYYVLTNASVRQGGSVINHTKTSSTPTGMHGEGRGVMGQDSSEKDSTPKVSGRVSQASFGQASSTRGASASVYQQQQRAAAASVAARNAGPPVLPPKQRAGANTSQLSTAGGPISPVPTPSPNESPKQSANLRQLQQIELQSPSPPLASTSAAASASPSPAPEGGDSSAALQSPSTAGATTTSAEPPVTIVAVQQGSAYTPPAELSDVTPTIAEDEGTVEVHT